MNVNPLLDVAPPQDMLGEVDQQFVPLDSKLNFEQRILNPEAYPYLTNEDGSISTHEMAWGELGDKFIAYPTIIQLPNGKLQRVPDEIATQWALDNKEYREFNTPDDADRYARGGYKFQWNAANKKGK
ncbi:MAG: putative LigA [Podoviridae sp. ctda_1]|nr:MAG: putative LigA [Podoviridae sp. ctda_1]